MKLEEFSLKEPFTVIVGALLVTIIGVVCLMKLPKDILPIFKTPAVQVITFYPGMPTEVVEKDITTRLERWTGQSNGIAMQESKSMIGVSILKDFFRSDIDPNTAMSQVTSFAMSDLYYLPPGTIPPMVMPFDPTASIPLALLTVENPEMNETQLYDIAYFNLRNMLQGIQGVIAPAVYGGRLRRILAYVDPYKMAGLNLSGLDVVRALQDSNVMIPTGNAKFGNKDYQIITNAMVGKVDDMNDFLIRGENGVPVRIKDVGKAEDSHQIQTNVVRIGGKRQVYIPIYRQPGANTIEIVDGIKSAMKSLLERLPKGMALKVVADQSEFVRKAIESIYFEVGLGGILSALVVLIFLGNLRASFAVFLSIPLSILACFIGLYATKETINAMTLGGLALAVGRLIDDSVVVLENTMRHREMGKPPAQAALEAAREVAMPVLAATVTTIIVFVPVVFLTGTAKFLFTPLAKSVTFSIIASYVVSMTIIPLFCATFLKGDDSHETTKKESLFSRLPFRHRKKIAPVLRMVILPFPEKLFGNKNASVHSKEGAGFERFANRYEAVLASWMLRKKKAVGIVISLFLASFLLYPFIGKELFPRADVGYMTLHLRLPTGTRIENTEAALSKVEGRLRELLGDHSIETMISNMGVLYDWPAAYTPNSGPGDAFIELELSHYRKYSTEKYARMIRELFKKEFPDIEPSINRGGLLTAALNMGSTSPINIQVAGKDLSVSTKIADEIVKEAKKVKGAVDVRILERIDYPQIEIELDRDAISAKRLTVDEVVKNIVTALNSSVNFKPAFWIDPKNGNHYFLGAQYPEELIKNLDTLKNLPLTGKGQMQVVLLKEIAKFKETTAPSEVRHRNIQRVIDVMVNTSGRDVGSVSSEISRNIRHIPLPEGYKIEHRGEVESMASSFQNLGGGLFLAVILIYLVLVAQFRSFRDPLLILFTVPMGLMGVLVTLWLTRTSLNIQSFIGVIFMVGIAVSNGILLIEFANRLKGEGASAEEAAIKAARVRLRPIVMTTLAALLGLLPMAIGFGHGAEANVPLGRAVLGGLLVSTILTLLVLPLLYVGLEKWKFTMIWDRPVKKFGMMLLFLLFAGNLKASEVGHEIQPKVMSLEEVMEIVLRQNPEIVIARARSDESRADLTIARSAYWPRVNLSGMDSFGLGGSSSATGITGLVNSPFRKGWGGGFDGSWTFFDFGRTQFKMKSAKKESLARSEEIFQQIAEVKLLTLRGFSGCALSTQLTQLLHEREKRQGSLVEEIEKYTRSGITSPVEEDLSKANLEQTHANQAEAGGMLGESVEQLKELMAAPDMEFFVCEMPSRNVNEPPSLPFLLDHALKNRPEIKAAQAFYESAHAAKRAAQLEHVPRLVAVSSVGVLNDTKSSGGDRWSTGVGVTMPIFDGFQMKGKIKKAKAQEEQAKAKLQEWRNRVKKEVTIASQQWKTAQTISEALEKQYELGKKAYELAHTRYQEKSGTFTELRDAEALFNRAEQEELKAKMGYQLTYHQLLIISAAEDLTAKSSKVEISSLKTEERRSFFRRLLELFKKQYGGLI